MRQVLMGGSLLGCLVLLVGLGSAQSPGARKQLTLPQRLAEAAKLPEDSASRFLQALGPVFRDELRRGKEVTIPGLGRFRVVRVEEHRDMQNGRPVTVPASNRVEFVAAEIIDTAANAEGVTPADTVVPFQYITLPGQTPSQKAPPSRTPPVRVK
jgi:nucleoid DNA-binding protein